MTETICEDGRVVGVRYRDQHGATHEARAPYIADASGHRTRVSGQVGDRVYSRFFQNVAVYGYYEHGKRLPSPNQGNILCAAFRDGWFWYIPVPKVIDGQRVVTVDVLGDRVQGAPPLEVTRTHAETIAAVIEDRADG